MKMKKKIHILQFCGIRVKQMMVMMKKVLGCDLFKY